MSSSFFVDKQSKPGEKELISILGDSAKLWLEFKHYLKQELGPLSEEWKFYSKKSGWQLKMLLKKRNLFFFTPAENMFRITFIFGDRAVAGVEQSSLPSVLIQELLNARKYMEGRGLSIAVKSKTELEQIKTLVSIKVNY